MTGVSAESNTDTPAYRNGLNADKRWIPILVNQTAGRCARASTIATLIHQLRQRGYEPEAFSDRTSYAAACTNPEAEASCFCQIAAGGDGTVAAAVNAAPRLPLAVLPLGTENLLAKHLGCSPNVSRFVAMLDRNERCRIDLGVANGRLFTLMTGCGFDAAVIHRLHANRAGHISRFAYAFTILRCLRRFSYPPVTVRLDTGEELNGTHAFLFNVPEYAFNLPIGRMASSNDGYLDLLLFTRPGIAAMGRYVCGLAYRPVTELTGVIHRKIKRATIRGDGGLLQTDGDPAGTTPVEVDIIVGGLETLSGHAVVNRRTGPTIQGSE